MANKIIPPSTSESSSPQEELEILFLQMQRTMVLWALSFYEKFFKAPIGGYNYGYLRQVFREKSPEETETLLKWLRKGRRFALVRIAYWMHLRLDDSRKLKETLFRTMLWLRTILWRIFPSLQYGNYERWIDEYDLVTTAIRQDWNKRISEWHYKPKISIVLERQSPKTIELSLKSVFSQPYTNWELVIVGSMELLEVARRITVNMNQEYRCSFVLKDDRLLFSRISSDYTFVVPELSKLSERSIFEVIQFLQSNKGDLIYGDEDTIDFKGIRSCPRFYPDWDIDFHLAQNLLRSLFVIRTPLLQQILEKNYPGPFDEQLLSVLLNPSALTATHIPSILAHSYKEYPYNVSKWQERSAKVAKSNFPGVEIVKGIGRRTRILWPLSEPPQEISLIIPTKDRVDLLSKLIDGLLNNTLYPVKEVIIINNHSKLEETHRYFKHLLNFPKVRIFDYNFPFNYSAINNFGAKYATGKILGFLNNDIEIITPTWLTEIVRQLLRPGVGIVGAKLYYKNNFVQHAGVVMGIGQVADHVFKLAHKSSTGYCDRLTFPHSYSAVTGACLFLFRSTFDLVNGFDAKNLPVAYNDVDLCLRVIEKGFRVIWTPYSELYHHESASRPIDTRIQQLPRYRKEIRYMCDRWFKKICNDPCYNINLTRSEYLCQVASESTPY